MKHILLAALAIICISCHKSNTTPTYTIGNTHWTNTTDSRQTLTITTDSITYVMPGIPSFTIKYQTLTHDTVILPINGTKIVMIPSKNELLYISTTYPDTAHYYR
jgi:hypothetical protein